MVQKHCGRLSRTLIWGERAGFTFRLWNYTDQLTIKGHLTSLNFNFLFKLSVIILTTWVLRKLNELTCIKCISQDLEHSTVLVTFSLPPQWPPCFRPDLDHSLISVVLLFFVPFVLHFKVFYQTGHFHVQSWYTDCEISESLSITMKYSVFWSVRCAEHIL